MRIAKLQVQNFKAFYGDEPYLFDFTKNGSAKNIFIYGENGSGKSSLFWTLYHILHSHAKPHHIQKYKNIFAKKKGKPLRIQMDFDNGSSFIYDETSEPKITIDDYAKEVFEKIARVKNFLSYHDIFLLNELFNHKISIDDFINTLSTLYSETLTNDLKKYKSYRQKLKEEYHDRLCDLQTQLKAFSNEYGDNGILDAIQSTKEENYADVASVDSHGKAVKNSYETIYYFSDEIISMFENMRESLEFFKNTFDFKDTDIDKIIEQLESANEYLQEHTKEAYEIDEELNIVNLEAIETLDVLEDITPKLQPILNFTKLYNEATELTKDLNYKIREHILVQTRYINQLLQQQFNIDLEIDLPQVDYFLLNMRDLDRYVPIKYAIKFSGTELPQRYTKFLNEAKISSINFAFYLSIILSYATLREFKILVLDDLLISLDMSNRDMVLELIINEFSDYQIIFLTHDRALFEMAKQKLNYLQRGEWKYFEMYIDRNENIEFPYIKEYGQTYEYIEIAKEYFKNKDYPVTANYLRKEVEKLYYTKLDLGKLESIVELARKIDNFEVLKENLPPLIKALKAFEKCKDIPESKRAKKCIEFANKVKKALDILKNEIEKDSFFNIGLIKDHILNPQSHYDFSKPIYKKELEDAFIAIEELQKAVDRNVLLRIKNKKAHMSKKRRKQIMRSNRCRKASHHY